MVGPVNHIDWNVTTNVDSRPIVKIGLISIGLTLALFLAWSTLAELDSAVVTPGTVVSDGRNKLIQHPTGGQVARIFAREGDLLAAGDVVVELDPTKAQADLSQLQARFASLSALKARLNAERNGDTFTMDGPLPSLNELRLGARDTTVTNSLGLRGASDAEAVRAVLADDPIARRIAGGASTPEPPPKNALMESQRDAFKSGRDLLTKEITALERKAQTLARQKEGQIARIEATRRLLDLAKREARRIAPLADVGYVPRKRLEDKLSNIAELEGNIAAMELDAAAFDSQRGEIEVQIERAKVARADAAAKEYASIVAELAEIEDRRRAALVTVRDLKVRAPVTGRLTKMAIATEGGVFGGGDVIGEIVPDGVPLVVEARVQPMDIDHVRKGQEADIVITALDRRLDDMLTGKVAYVAADAALDEKTGEQYFVVRLALDDGENDAALMAKVQPGMQAEVYIHTGARTFLDYMTRPIVDSFRRAFRER